MGYKNGLFIFLFRQFFRNIPHELDEAAAIDGCGPFKTFFHIMLPTAGTMITTVFLLSFSWQWTDTYYNGLFFKGFSVLPTVINLAQMANPDMAPTCQRGRHIGHTAVGRAVYICPEVFCGNA